MSESLAEPDESNDVGYDPFELQTFRDLARSVTSHDHDFDDPPAGLFERIERLVTSESEVEIVESGPATGLREIRDVASPARRARGSQARRRNRAAAAFLAAAATVAIIVGAVVARSDNVTEVAQAALSNNGLAPEGEASSGQAKLVKQENGTFAIELRVKSVPQVSSGFFEVWIIDPNVKGMFSLGPLRGPGRYQLPDNVDWHAYPIVDISIEPTDGVASHSGKSILRGVLA